MNNFEKGWKQWMDGKNSLLDDADRIARVMMKENGGKSPSSLEVARRLYDETKEKDNDHEQP